MSFPLSGLFPLGSRRLAPLPYDAEVDFVESTGAQYVDTGTNADNTTVMTVAGLFPSTTGNPVIFGLADNTVSPTVRFSVGKQIDDRLRAYLDTSTNAINLIYSWGTRTTFELDAATAAFRVGSNVATRPSFTWTSNLPIYLFARNGAGTADSFASIRIYGVEIKKSGAIIRSFVPVRVGTTGALYDRANPTGGPLGNGLYGSATATPLVAGPDKNGG